MITRAFPTGHAYIILGVVAASHNTLLGSVPDIGTKSPEIALSLVEGEMQSDPVECVSMTSGYMTGHKW